ncbi:CD99 antigen [Bombina bombina]|uniref:CD99 antigen n=1 Tax=Bombina bombina TaxID=8345 RepID=UPI00235A6FA5|nr:CD99 antigen [Bombina bombina]
MITRSIAVLFCLAFAAVQIRGQDFDLGDALDEERETTPSKKLVGDIGPTKPPTNPAPKPNPDGGDSSFDLGDALGPDDSPKPTPKPQPGGGGGDGREFGDADLIDGGKPLPPDDDPPHSGGQDTNEGGQNQSVLAGVLSAVGVAIVGAASSFFAYQKKKLCFKQEGDPENVNMDDKRAEQADPQAQNALLSK